MPYASLVLFGGVNVVAGANQKYTVHYHITSQQHVRVGRSAHWHLQDAQLHKIRGYKSIQHCISKWTFSGNLVLLCRVTYYACSMWSLNYSVFVQCFLHFARSIADTSVHLTVHSYTIAQVWPKHSAECSARQRVTIWPKFAAFCALLNFHCIHSWKVPACLCSTILWVDLPCQSARTSVPSLKIFMSVFLLYQTQQSRLIQTSHHPNLLSSSLMYLFLGSCAQNRYICVYKITILVNLLLTISNAITLCVLKSIGIKTKFGGYIFCEHIML